MKTRVLTEKIGFTGLMLASALVVLILFGILANIFYNGFSVLSWGFLTESPREGMTAGGILPAIIGTLLVSLITIILAVPLGMFSAIYLNEYAYQGRLVRLIRLSIRNLSGVPSIVYGLFGVALFVRFLHFGASILSGRSDLRTPDPALDDHRQRGGPEDRAQGLSGWGPGPGGHQMAGHPHQCSSLCRARHADRGHTGVGPSRR